MVHNVADTDEVEDHFAKYQLSLREEECFLLFFYVGGKLVTSLRGEKRSLDGGKDTPNYQKSFQANNTKFPFYWNSERSGWNVC